MSKIDALVDWIGANTDRLSMTLNAGSTLKGERVYSRREAGALVVAASENSRMSPSDLVIRMNY